MKKNELLQDAIGLISDDLILDAKSGKKAAPIRWLPRVAALAACLGLLIGGIFLLQPEAPEADMFLPPTLLDPNPSQPPTAPTLPNRPTPGSNLWEQEGFRTYSLIYDNTSPAKKGLVRTEPSLPENILYSSEIVLSGFSSVKTEALIGGRYVAYISENDVPIFFDTQQGVAVDLRQQVLGEDGANLEEFLARVETLAREQYPGMLDSEINRQFLEEYIRGTVNETQLPSVYDWELDTAFMIRLGIYDHATEERRKLEFSSMCSKIYRATIDALKAENSPLITNPFRVKFLSMDAYTGRCIIQIMDLAGKSRGVRLYDVATNTTLATLPNTYRNSYYARYSADGKLITYACHNGGLSGSASVFNPDFTQRHEYEDSQFILHTYVGECIYIIDTETGIQTELWHNAASEGYLSDSGKVCYFKNLPEECTGKDFYIPGNLWYDRLISADRDTDQWVFCTDAEGTPYGKKTVLQGNFVRFAADDTVAIMERDGKYYAYLLGENPMTDQEANSLFIINPLCTNKYIFLGQLYHGQDITQQLMQGDLELAPHERLRLFVRDGVLCKQDLFSGEDAQFIAPADQFCLTGDGAFVFAYCAGSEYVTCHNVVTLESCYISLGDELRTQLKAMENAVFQMLYDDSEMVLTLSFYQEEAADEEQPYFLDLLAQLGGGSYYENGQPIQSQVYTQYQVSQQIMDQFRQSALDYEKLMGMIYNELYYPECFSVHTTEAQLFEALGIERPNRFLYVDGTEFHLYEDEDESLILYFYNTRLDLWPESTCEPEDTGFYLVYTTGSKTFTYYSQKPVAE